MININWCKFLQDQRTFYFNGIFKIRKLKEYGQFSTQNSCFSFWQKFLWSKMFSFFAKTFIDNVGFSTKVLRNRRKVVIHQIISSFLSCVYRLESHNKIGIHSNISFVAQKNCKHYFEDIRQGEVLSKIECTGNFTFTVHCICKIKTTGNVLQNCIRLSI